MNLNADKQDSLALLRWFRNNAKILFFVALFLSLVTVVGGSIQMLQIAFDSQPECVAHSQLKNETATSHRAAKSSC